MDGAVSFPYFFVLQIEFNVFQYLEYYFMFFKYILMIFLNISKLL